MTTIINVNIYYLQYIVHDLDAGPFETLIFQPQPNLTLHQDT